jgi:hypothetical protein
MEALEGKLHYLPAFYIQASWGTSSLCHMQICYSLPDVIYHSFYDELVAHAILQGPECNTSHYQWAGMMPLNVLGIVEMHGKPSYSTMEELQ